MTKKTTPAYRASKEETIPINKLHPFSNHPFHIRHDLEFSELVDSISESGIITPIIVRPKVGVGYEVISGHRRWEACKELGIESIPARVEYIRNMPPSGLRNPRNSLPPPIGTSWMPTMPLSAISRCIWREPSTAPRN